MARLARTALAPIPRADKRPGSRQGVDIPQDPQPGLRRRSAHCAGGAETAEQSPSPAPRPPPLHPRLRLAFIDGSVLNVALPAIGRSFHAATAEVQWVIN